MNTKLSSAVKAFSLGILAVSVFSALGQEVTEQDGNSIYSSAFFSQYNPQNALEMVDRLPGFAFDEGSNARGFGGNAGNVLIDGARPTSKSSGLRGALIRIPAAQVERIEILRGGIGAGEAAGQSIVANVIRVKTGSSGTWAMKLRQVDGANIEPNLEAALSTHVGDWDTSFDTDIGGWPGFRSARFEYEWANGDLRDSSTESLVSRNRWTYVNGEGSTTVADGKLTINGRVGGNHYRDDASRQVFLGRLPDDSAHENFWSVNSRQENKEYELGVDWTKSETDWKWRIIGLTTREDNKFSGYQQEGTVDGSQYDNSLFLNERTETETIARTTFSYLNGGDFKPELGVEIANNELDKSQELFFNDVRFDGLTNANVLVEERRAEAFANAVWEANDKLTVEGGLTVEYSEIQLTGDDNNKQKFTFYKPRVSATYRFDDEHRVTAEAVRRVGQLDFDLFAAGRDISDGSNNSGNSNLRPDQVEELAFTYDWSFSERGNVKIKAFHEWRKDILEHIELVPDSRQYGTGNAGDARFWGIITDISLPIDGFLENGLLELRHRYRGSEFYDDVINADRTISWYTPNWYGFELRQDLTEHKVTWGVEYDAHFLDVGYRANEVQTFRGNNRWSFYVETTRYFGVKIKLEVNQASTSQYTRTRFIYRGMVPGSENDPNAQPSHDRGDDLVSIERSFRFRDPELRLTFSGSF